MPHDDLTEFIPDAKHINALPEPLRNYIRDLETMCDPAGMANTIACQEQQIKALVVKMREEEKAIVKLVYLVNALLWNLSSDEAWDEYDW